MVSGRGLSPGLLVRRGAAKPLLHRGDPAQAPEAAQELPGACQIGNGAGLTVSDEEFVLAGWPIRGSLGASTGGGGGARSAPFRYSAAARRRRSLMAMPSP